MKPRDQYLIFHFAALAAALVAFALSGCASVSQGGICDRLFSSQPDTLEYPGKEHFWNKAGLVISPARILAQVGTEVPMFAGVCNDKGQLEPYEKVEWTLDNSGVGSFIDVAEAHRPFILNLVSDKPKKIDASYAVSETLPDNVILTRGTKDINDDMVMPHGYTWVTVSSGKEGISYVTAFAPDVFSWNARQRSAVIHWIDAEWSFPEPVCGTAGKPVALCTCVVRHTTKAPVADWIVKYTITGGAAAGLGKEDSTSVEIATDADGRACVEVIPAAETSSGTTCIRAELIRSECAAGGAGERLPIASSATQVTWGTAAVETTAPATVAPAAPATPMPTPGPAPRTLAPPVTTPQIQTPVPPPAQPAAAPRLELNVTGPQTAQLGEDITFNVEITNRGNAPATGLIVVDQHDRNSLRHYNDDGSPDTGLIQKSLDTLGPIAPGQSKQVQVKFRVVAPGNLCHTVEIRGPGGLYDTKQICVTVAAPPEKPPQPAMRVDIAAPQTVYHVNDSFIFQIDIRNTDTTVTAHNVKADVTFDTGLTFTQASQGFRQIPSGVEFLVDTLVPEARQTFQVQCKCVAPAQRACGQVAMSDAADQHLSQQFCVQIQPAAPAAAGPSGLNVTVGTSDNPVKQNGEATYRVTISNGGLNSEKQVQLRITIPNNMQVVGNPIGPTVPTVEGQTITFGQILELRPNESPLNYDLRLRPTSPGAAEVVATVTSQNLLQPITKSETITINP